MLLLRTARLGSPCDDYFQEPLFVLNLYHEVTEANIPPPNSNTENVMMDCFLSLELLG